MGNPFKRAFNSVKKLGEKEIKNIVKTIEDITGTGGSGKTETGTVPIARTYMGNFNLTNLSMPNNAGNGFFGTQLQSLLNQGVAVQSIFYPTITNYGLAPALMTDTAVVVGQVQPPELFNHGFLSQIILYVNSNGTISGLLQYFGDVPGIFIGTTDSSSEIPFNVAMGDYITQAWVVYRATPTSSPGTSGGIAAIRFFTECGSDSGWIGSLAHGGTLCTYMSFAPAPPAAPQRLLLRPIYCFDGWTQQGTSLTLGARFTNPYEVTVEVDDICPVKDLNGDPISVSDAWSRTWNFTNGSSTAQQMSMSDTITSTSTQTLSKTETDSKSVSTATSIAFTATAIFDAGTASGSWSRTSTTTRTHTTTTSDSTTVSTSTEEYFSYPLIVPPNSSVVCDVEVYQGFSQAAVTLGVSWAGAPPTTMPLHYIGTDDIEIRVNITQTPIPVPVS